MGRWYSDTSARMTYMPDDRSQPASRGLVMRNCRFMLIVYEKLGADAGAAWWATETSRLGKESAPPRLLQ